MNSERKTAVKTCDSCKTLLKESKMLCKGLAKLLEDGNFDAFSTDRKRLGFIANEMAKCKLKA